MPHDKTVYVSILYAPQFAIFYFILWFILRHFSPTTPNLTLHLELERSQYSPMGLQEHPYELQALTPRKLSVVDGLYLEIKII